MRIQALLCVLACLVGWTQAQTYSIGVVTAAYANRSSDLVNKRFAAHAQQAYNDLIDGTIKLSPALPSNVTLTLLQRSSYLTPTGAFISSEDAIQKGAIVIVGPFASDEAVPVATLGSALKIPIFSPSASTSEVSDKTRVPYFMRGVKVDVSVGPPLLRLFKRMNWKKVCYIGSNDVYGRGLLNSLLASTLTTDTTITGLLFPAIVNNNTTFYAEATLRTLLSKDCRIFVLHCISSYAAAALQAADRVGILNNPKYLLVGTADWTPNVGAYTGSHPMNGAYAILPVLPANPLYQPYAERFIRTHPELLWGATPFATTDVNWYDCVWYTAQAIANLLANGKAVTGSNMLTMMQTMNFSGITGDFVFDSNYDRVQAFDLVNFPYSNGSFNRLARYDAGTDEFISYPNAPAAVYPEGATEVARDGVSVLYGDKLEPTEDGAVIVLAFIVGGISSWCSMILVEQIMYAAEKNQRWWNWALACAITQGGPGIWALHIIGMCAMSWPAPVDILYDPGFAVAGLVVAIVATWLAFASAMMGVTRNKEMMEAASSAGNSQQPATGQKAAAAAIAATRANNTTTGGSKQKYEQEKTQTVSQEADSGASTMTKKRRLIKQLSADHSIWAQFKVLPLRVNLWFILSGMLLSVGTTVAHELVSSALPNALGRQIGTTLPIIYTIIAVPLFTFAMLMLYYFFPQADIRFTAALAMHMIVFGSHMTINHGQSYYYSASSDDTTHWWTVREVILVVSLGTALLCFVLLGVNVVRMKLSRNALDLIVVRFKKELASTVAQVQTERDATLAQRKEKEKLWRMLETINMCRPLHRDHALATTLADYEAEAAPLLNTMNLPSGNPSSPVPGEAKAFEEELKVPKIRAGSAMSIYQQLCSTLQLNGPTPDAVARDVKLEHILRHPVTLEIFKDAMIKEHNAENLMLYLDIRRYKSTTDQQLRSMLSREIFDTFIARGARYEVNVSDIMRKQLEAKFAFRPGVLSPASEDYLPTPIDLFASIEDELMKLIHNNNWPRFIATPAFNLCALLLGRPQFRVKPIAAAGRAPASTHEVSGQAAIVAGAMIAGGNNGISTPNGAIPPTPVSGGYSPQAVARIRVNSTVALVGAGGSARSGSPAHRQQPATPSNHGATAPGYTPTAIASPLGNDIGDQDALAPTHRASVDGNTTAHITSPLATTTRTVSATGAPATTAAPSTPTHTHTHSNDAVMPLRAMVSSATAPGSSTPVHSSARNVVNQMSLPGSVEPMPPPSLL